MVIEEPYIESLTWDSVRAQVSRSCSQLTKIIDEISPSKQFKLLKVRYPFGATIIHEGVAYFPTEQGQILPITDSRLPLSLRNELGYNLIPLGIVVKNNIEVFKEFEDRVFSVAFLGNGLHVGIWEYFDWTTPYTVTAGARSLYLLPKVTLAQGHKRLKREYNLSLSAPKNSPDHWRLFKQIVNSQNFKEKWTCEIVCLASKWVDKLNGDDAWNKLNKHLLHQGWLHSDYARKKSIFDVIWQLFARSLNQKGLKPNSYVLDTLKHLTFLGTGVLPGNNPAVGSGAAGPIDGIQLAYIETYGIKDYIPTIMQPGYLSLEKANSIYYSLQAPSLLESVPQSRNLTSIIDNVRELEELTDHFLTQAFDENLKFGQIKINDIINQLKFEFFHAEAYAYGDVIRSAREMPKNDKNLLYSPSDTSQFVFPDTSPYLHGCVRISTNTV